MPEPPVVQISALRKRFGRRGRGVIALDGVSLTIARGEVFGLLGRNGAGKTTLVRSVLGLVRPTDGSVRVFGAGPGELDVHRRIGYSPEEPGFPSHLYPRQVLGLLGALSGLEGRALETAIEQHLTLAELTPVAARQVRHLSKGMRQRLSIAQALLHEPELLILDEPTADLDPIGRRQVRDLIAAYNARGGTVLVNSHLLSEVERMCGRVAIIHAGRVVREGTVDDLVGVDRELEDVFVEAIEGAGGGVGYATPPAQGPPAQGPPAGWSAPWKQ